MNTRSMGNNYSSIIDDNLDNSNNEKRHEIDISKEKVNYYYVYRNGKMLKQKSFLSEVFDS